jgi:hypothetical protein
MNPLFWALFASVGLCSILTCSWLSVLDRAWERGRDHRLPVAGVDVPSLPGCIAIPTAQRLARPDVWATQHDKQGAAQ